MTNQVGHSGVSRDELALHFDGELTGAQAHELAAQIDADPELRDELAQLGIVQGLVQETLKTKAAQVPQARFEQIWDEIDRQLDQEAAACQRIVDDLLAYGRDPDLSLERLGTRAFLGDAARRFASTDLGSGVDLARDIEDAKLEVDPVRMRQVVDNLLSNAAEFSEAGATVVLRGALLDQDTYRIEVLDRGPGIPEDQRERVFEPFRSSRPGGTGLGLAISRVIVSAHRGQIRAVPRPGGGSSIQIDLPRAQESGR